MKVFICKVSHITHVSDGTYCIFIDILDLKWPEKVFKINTFRPSICSKIQGFQGLRPLEPHERSHSHPWIIALIHTPLGKVLFVKLVENTPLHPDVLWHGLDNHFDYPVNHVLMSITKGRFFKFLHALAFIFKILPFFWKPPLPSKIPRCAPGLVYFANDEYTSLVFIPMVKYGPIQSNQRLW